MRAISKKAISTLFNVLFFFIPLIVFPKTSELFEFNKMVVTYALTVLIMVFWVVRMIYQRQIIFRRTILDIPLLVFLFSQTVSTIISIDPTTSLFGYYSRAHGGLLSYLAYGLLYWAWVSNMDAKKSIRSLYFLTASFILVCLYGVAQRLGVDKDIWVQDVVNRVFSSLGQPNWLAAWIVAVVPLTWVFWLEKGKSKTGYVLWGLASLLSFLVLLFTKSRSGLLGFAVADAVFWFFVFRKNTKITLSWHISILALAAVLGTIWTPSISSLLAGQPAQEVAPEPGGTESGDIRKIVWKGAIEIWKKHPILGTGVETFAYSYWGVRPAQHNLTSEWEYLYNKAHNEYLNFAANTGSLGFVSYLAFISVAVLAFRKNLRDRRNYKLNLALLSGFLSILVTDFFGFSVVPVAIVFFIFPAISEVITREAEIIPAPKLKLSAFLKLGIFAALALGSYFLFLVFKYWYADFVYAKGKDLNDSSEPFRAEEYLRRALKLNSRPSLYWDELSAALGTQSLSWYESGDAQKAKSLAEEAILLSEKALEISPMDLSLKKSQASLFIRLSQIDPGYMAEANRVFAEASLLAPTDAKVFYNLGLSLVRLGKKDEARAVLEKAVELKANYRDARFALALVYIDNGKYKEAKSQLVYILEKISPNDPLVKQQLEEIP
jgi:O-antigen ligase/Tfp pilus assembly protein PilF